MKEKCKIELRKFRILFWSLNVNKINKKFPSERRMYYVVMFKIRIRFSTAFKNYKFHIKCSTVF